MESFSWIPVRSKNANPLLLFLLSLYFFGFFWQDTNKNIEFLIGDLHECAGTKNPTSDPPRKGRRHESPFCVRLTCLQTKPINQPADFIKVEPRHSVTHCSAKKSHEYQNPLHRLVTCNCYLPVHFIKQ